MRVCLQSRLRFVQPLSRYRFDVDVGLVAPGLGRQPGRKSRNGRQGGECPQAWKLAVEFSHYAAVPPTTQQQLSSQFKLEREEE